MILCHLPTESLQLQEGHTSSCLTVLWQALLNLGVLQQAAVLVMPSEH